MLQICSTKNSEILIYFYNDSVFQKEHLILACRPSLIIYLIAFLCEFCAPQSSLCPILQMSKNSI